MVLRFNPDSPERMFKQAARSVKTYIYSFGVGVEQIGKLLINPVPVL
jgi:hypothetical protein